MVQEAGDYKATFPGSNLGMSKYDGFIGADNIRVSYTCGDKPLSASAPLSNRWRSPEPGENAIDLYCANSCSKEKVWMRGKENKQFKLPLPCLISKRNDAYVLKLELRAPFETMKSKNYVCLISSRPTPLERACLLLDMFSS